MRRLGVVSILIGFWLVVTSANLSAQSFEINSLEKPADLSGTWKFHTGDNLEWSKPEFDDSQWGTLRVPGNWGNQGYQGYGGFAWYRVEVRFKSALKDRSPQIPLALSLRFKGSGAYEVFAGGRQIGNAGYLPPTVKSLTPPTCAFFIPPTAIDSQGKLVIAIRCWLDTDFARIYPDDGGFSFEVRLGEQTVINQFVTNENQKQFVSDLPQLLCVLLVILSSLYHLYLFTKRRELKEYFWFGIYSLSLAVLGLAGSKWFMTWAGWSVKWWFFWGRFHHPTTVLLIQFLWPFLGTRINKFWRGCQIFLLLLMGLRIVISPAVMEQSLVVAGPIEILIFLATIRLSLISAWKGNQEGRLISIGFLCQMVLVLITLAQKYHFVHLPLQLSSIYSSLFIVVVMGLSLLNRFNRVYTDLETLNRDLETKVEARTAELDRKNLELAENFKLLEAAKLETEQKNKELALAKQEADTKNLELEKKNQELIASQQQADRIFSALAEALPGTVLDGKYRLDKKIGEGGFGAVFKSTHLALNRPIAVKVFKPSPGNDSADAVERFKLEGISASRLNHPNIVSVLDSGISQEGIAYLVMELLEGHSLTAELRSYGKLSLQRCMQIVVPICRALTEAHRLGILHRDIKPDNVFLNQTAEGETVKVVDFGIAKLVGEDTSEDLKKLTATGAIVGTPTYIAPERLSGSTYDGKSDVYSVGVMLYEMLCGRPPFEPGQNGWMGVFMAHLHEKPQLLRLLNPNISPEIELVVLETLAKNPKQRPNAKELADKFMRACEYCELALKSSLETIPQMETRSHDTTLVSTKKNDLRPIGETLAWDNQMSFEFSEAATIRHQPNESTDEKPQPKEKP